jgi:hypothetical protein
MEITCLEGKALHCNTANDFLPFINGKGKDESVPVCELTLFSSYVVRRSFPAFNVMVDYEGSLFFNSMEQRAIKVTVTNSQTQMQQQWTRITLYTPPDVTVSGGQSIILPLNNLWESKAVTEFFIDTSTYKGAKLELIVDVALEGRHSNGQIKVTLMREIRKNKGEYL